MSAWTNICAAATLADRQKITADVDGVAVIVINLDGQLYAIEDLCSHDGAEIASGELVGDEIVCPRHGARFCVRTGAVTAPPAYEDIACFQVRVADGIIQVRDGRWDINPARKYGPG